MFRSTLKLVWLGLVLSISMASALANNRLALVIGNDAYRSVTALHNARNDAKLIASTLRDAKFDVTFAENLDRNRLWVEIDRFKNRIRKGDEVVFYFAGHGVQIGSNQLLLPVDISAQNDRQVERDGVPLIDIQDALKDARTSVFIIDACRDNPFPKQGTRTIGGTRGLIPPDVTSGQIVILSAGRNQKALDTVPGQSTQNGLFTYELVQVIKSGNPEVRTAFEQVKQRVDDKAKRNGHEQRPSVVSDLNGNFFFFIGSSSSLAVNGQPEAQLPATRLQSADEIEQQAWDDAQKANTVGTLEAYLAEYPRGRFAGRARIRVAALTPQFTPPTLVAQREQELLDTGMVAVKIGHVAPLSGPQAHYGKDNENGVRMAIDDLNAQSVVIGGKKVKFEIVSEDDASNPRQGTAAARNLCDSKVAGVVGHLNSGTTIAASKVYNDCGIPHVTGSATNPNLTKPGYKTSYRIIANDNALGAGLAFFAADALKLRNVAIIDDRTAYGQGVAEVFRRVALAKGMKVVDEQFTTDKAADFMAILTAIKAKNPDAIFFGGMAPQAGPMLRQMEQLGMDNVKYFGGDGICTPELAKLAEGAKTIGNVVCAEGGASLTKMPGGEAWKRRYDAKYPNQFQVYSPYTYDATFVLVDAMKRANSVDPKVYTAELSKVNFSGVATTIAFEANGELKNPPMTLYVYKNGRKFALN